MSMMNVKRSTQTFSAAQPSSLGKSEGINNLSTSDAKRVLGDQSVGDVLNKIADPNWVDPSKKLRGVGDSTLDKDAFLKLMLAQMKHQDPTNPMQSHEMAAQLAQFTSLEQLNNINTTLEGMKNAQAPSVNYQALGFIGKKVSGDSSKLVRAAGDTEHLFNFQLTGDAAKAKVNVKDAAGNIIRKLEFGELKKGANSVKWNGLGDDGLAARPGEYKFSVEAQTTNGSKVYSKTEFEGRITGLNYAPEGPVLMVNGQTIRLADVKKIEEAGPEDAMTAAASATATTLAPPLNVPPAEEPEGQPGNIEDVPMERAMLNQLAKAK